MLPDFNRLKVFYHVYALNSVVEAAKALHLSQPAVSQHLRKLEGEIKTPLFTRLHKKLVPTAAGQQLFEIVKPFVEQLEGNIARIRQPLNQPSGTLRIGAPLEFGKRYLPPICQAFRQTYPAVNFVLKLGEPVPILGLIREGRLDIALIDFFLVEDLVAASHGLYSVEPIFDEELMLACSRHYYDAHIKWDLSFEKLAAQDFICDEHNIMVLHHWFKHHFNRSVPDLNVVMTIDSHEAVVSGLKLGMGLGVTATHFVWKDMEQGAIKPIPTTVKNSINEISTIRLQDKVPTLTEKYFYRFFKEEMEALRRAGARNPKSHYFSFSLAETEK